MMKEENIYFIVFEAKVEDDLSIFLDRIKRFNNYCFVGSNNSHFVKSNLSASEVYKILTKDKFEQSFVLVIKVTLDDFPKNLWGYVDSEIWNWFKDSTLNLGEETISSKENAKNYFLIIVEEGIVYNFKRWKMVKVISITEESNDYLINNVNLSKSVDSKSILKKIEGIAELGYLRNFKNENKGTLATLFEENTKLIDLLPLVKAKIEEETGDLLNCEIQILQVK